MLCCEQRTFWLDTQSATLSWGKSLYAKSAKSARLLAALPHPDIPDGASPQSKTASALRFVLPELNKTAQQNSTLLLSSD